MKAIKGFDRDFKCRGFQFEVGKTYTANGKIKACRNGFHAIHDDAHPLSVLKYYGPTSRFAIVEIDGKTDRDGDKIAAEIMTVKKEISLHDLTQEAVSWVMARTKPEGEIAKRDNGLATASGYQGAATASGNNGAATASGDQGTATASGDQGTATASGYHGAATASGYQGAATVSGNNGAATASGDYGTATASGDQGTAMATGYHGHVRGSIGSAVFAVERDAKRNIMSVACGIVGQDGILPDTWYLAKDGKLVSL